MFRIYRKHKQTDKQVNAPKNMADVIIVLVEVFSLRLKGTTVFQFSSAGYFQYEEN